MGYIFISYSHKDQKYVEKLAKYLGEKGFDAWFDYRIRFGMYWSKALEKAIDDSDAFIVVVSNAAKESEWVTREILRAQAKNKPLFPLLLEGEKWLLLQDIPHVDVIDGSLPTEKFIESLGSVAESIMDKPRVSQFKRKKNKLDLKKTLIPLLFVLMVVVLGISRLVVPVIFKPVPTPVYSDTPEPEIPKTQEPTVTNIPTSVPSHAGTSVYQAGDTWDRPADGMTMSYIPAGEFHMGSNDGDDSEKPVHIVYVDGFWIDQTEVTNAMYLKCMDAGRCNTPYDDYYKYEVYADHPVVSVTRNDAESYCEWVGIASEVRDVRIPTEIEWEKAARGGLEGKLYPWGDMDPICDKGAENGAQFTLCGGGTVPVDYFSPNNYGVFGMSGNAWEWVDAYFDAYPGGEGSSEYFGLGLSVLRGGSWWNDPNRLRVAFRLWGGPVDVDSTDNTIGFRCARSATPQETPIANYDILASDTRGL